MLFIIQVKHKVGVSEKMSERRYGKILKWFGHVQHTSWKQLTKRVCKSEVEETRDRGRPYVRYLDGDIKAFKAKSMKLSNAKVMCMDRVLQEFINGTNGRLNV